MKLLISPAKSLDYTSTLPTLKHSQSLLLNKAEIIQETLRTKTPKELAKLMHISDKLAQLNWQRNQDWQLPFSIKNARAAIYAFNGDVYSGLDAYTISEHKIDELQNKLRILSGLYGLLKPLDLIQPYRLEMGTKLNIGSDKNLYSFWKNIITETLNNEIKKGELIINLASLEYFKAIDTKKLNGKIITINFKDYKNNVLKTISFYAKKARGKMVRYIIDNQIETINDIKQFNIDNYTFDANLSTENSLVFTR